MSSPERGRQPYSNYPAAGAYEDPYYAQYGPRSGSITPVIDEEARYVSTLYSKCLKFANPEFLHAL